MSSEKYFIDSFFSPRAKNEKEKLDFFNVARRVVSGDLSEHQREISSDPGTFDRSFSNCNFFVRLSLNTVFASYFFSPFLSALFSRLQLWNSSFSAIFWISEREREQKTARKCILNATMWFSAAALLKCIFHRLWLASSQEHVLGLAMLQQLPYKIFTFSDSLFPLFFLEMGSFNNNIPILYVDTFINIDIWLDAFSPSSWRFFFEALVAFFPLCVRFSLSINLV